MGRAAGGYSPPPTPHKSVQAERGRPDLELLARIEAHKLDKEGAEASVLRTACAGEWLAAGPPQDEVITQPQHGYTVAFTLGVVVAAGVAEATVTSVAVSGDGSGDGSSGGEGGAGGGCGGNGEMVRRRWGRRRRRLRRRRIVAASDALPNF